LPFPPCQPQPPSGGNQAPVADPQTLATAESTPLSITLTGSDADGDTLTYAIVAQPAHGTLTRTGAEEGGGEGDLGPAAFTYTPSPGYAGADSFTFKVNDGQADSNVATVTITITALPATIDAFAATAIPAPTASITATPSTGIAPLTSTVTWSTANASAVTVTGPGLTATDASGSATVTNAPGTHTCTVTAQPQQHTTLTWTASHAATIILETPSGDLDVTGQTSAGITEPGEYRLRVSNSAGAVITSTSLAVAWPAAATASATITVTDSPPAGITAFAATNPPAPAVTISAEPANGMSPLSSTVAWTSANAASVSVSGPGLSSAAATGTQSVTNSAVGEHTYSITAQPIQSATLSWTVSGATTLTLSGPGGLEKIVTGHNSATVTTAGDWSLIATNAAGVATTSEPVTVILPTAPASASATVRVTTPPPATISSTAVVNPAAPAVSITADPVAGVAPFDSTVSWQSNNAASVSVSGPGLDSTEPAGSASVSVSSAGGHAYTITAQPAQEATISWTTNNAASLQLTGPGGLAQDVSGQTSAIVSVAGEWRLVAANSVGAVTTSSAITVVLPDPVSATATIIASEAGSGSLSVDAGPDQMISLPSTATLNPTVLENGYPPSGTVAYSWTASTVEGIGIAILDNASAEKPVLTFTAPGVYILTLVASSNGKTGTDFLTIIVNPAPATAEVAPVSSEGYDYWITFLMSMEEGDIARYELVVSSGTEATGVIEEEIPEFDGSGNQTGSRIKTTNFRVAANAPYRFFPETYNTDLRYNTFQYNKKIRAALHIRSNAPITVHGLNAQAYITDGFTCLPTTLLGQDYILISNSTDAWWGRSPASIVILATEDDTVCTVDPVVRLDGFSSVEPFEVTLNKGEIIRYSSRQGDITGSTVYTTKPVVILTGAECINIPGSAEACDVIVEQMLPVDLWGKNYLMLPMKKPYLDRFNGDLVRVVASQDDTVVSFDGLPVATLAAGTYYDSIEVSPRSIVANKPVHVAQFMQGMGVNSDYTGDPLMLMLPAIEQYGSRFQFGAFSRDYANNDPFRHFAGIIVEKDSLSSLRLNGTPIAGSNFVSIANTRFVGANIEVAEGFNVIESDTPFFGIGWGTYEYESYGFTGAITVSRPVGDLTLLPGTLPPAAIVGSQQEISARVVNTAGEPVGGVGVQFIVNGVNVVTAQANTDAQGWARMTYRGVAAGADTITAKLGDKETSWSLLWRYNATSANTAPRLTLSGPETLVLNDGPAAFSVHVVDDGLPAAPGAVSLRWEVRSGFDGPAIDDPASATPAITFYLPGRYLVHVTASDGELETTASQWVNVIGASNIRLIKPYPNTLAVLNRDTGAVTLNYEATVYSDIGINRVEFWADGQKLGQKTAAPWTWEWTTSQTGSHTVFAKLVETNNTVIESGPVHLQINPPLEATHVLTAGVTDYVEDAPLPVTVTVNHGAPPYEVEFLATGPAPDNEEWYVPAYESDAIDPATGLTTWTMDWAGLPAGEYTLYARIHDSRGNTLETTSAIVSITEIPAVNRAPDVRLGGGMTLPLNTVLGLRPFVRDDGLPTGSTLVHRWIQVSGPGAATFADPASPETTVTFSAQGVYVLRLEVSDGALTGSAEITLTIEAAGNTAPQVNIGDGSPLTLPFGATLRIPAAVADDGLPATGQLTATWITLAAPPGGSVTTAAAPDPRDAFDYVLTFSAQGDYTLRLTASDGELETSADLAVTVGPPGNAAPQVRLGDDLTLPPGTDLRIKGFAYDDGLPNPPAALTLQWTVTQTPAGVSAAGVSFTPDNALETVAHFPAQGVYTLRLTASDGAREAYDEIIVKVTSAVNQAPLVNAGAPVTLNVNQILVLNGAAIDDGLPNPPALLTYLWIVSSESPAPAASVIFLDDSDQPLPEGQSPNILQQRVRFSDTGTYILNLTASDGALTSHPSGITITVTDDPLPPPANQPPAVAVPADFTVTQSQTVNVGGAVSDDGLPADPGAVSVTWSATPQRPENTGGVTIVTPAALTTPVTFLKAGVYTLTLTAYDGELQTSASVTVTVLASSPPSPPPGDPSQETLTIVSFYPPQTVTAGSPELYIESDASDSSGSAVTVEYIITGPALAGGELRHTTPAAPWYRWDFADLLPPGTYTMSAIARNESGHEAQANTATVTVIPDTSNPGGGPGGAYTLALSSPAEDDMIITATPATGIIAVPGLLGYSLQLRPADDPSAEWTTLLTVDNASPVGDPAFDKPGELGLIDPSLLRNGYYELRIAATTTTAPASAPLASDPVRILVDGKRKVGNFSLAFKDLALPLAGLPIEIVRGYDSRDRSTQGDFGYGWSLGVNAVTLTKNRAIGSDWWMDVQYYNSIGGEISLYTLDSANDEGRPVKHLVTLGFPDDTMATFEAAVEVIGGVRQWPFFPYAEANQSYTFPIENVRLVFKPANTRTKGRLEIEGSVQAWLPEAREDLSGPQILREDYYPGAPVFNPTRFRYTAEDGTVYIIDEHLGLVSITDPQGNQLAVERNAQTGRIEQIVHSSGQAVLFNRDGEGRISHITDPYGAEIAYVYGAHGDLIGVANRAAETTTFDYYTTSTDPHDGHLTHFLKDIIDPSGTLVMRTEYDGQGRLIKQTDAHGNPVTFERDTSAGIEKIRNRLGYVTEHHYDAEGNVTRTINPDGGITDYEFTDPNNPNAVTRQIDPLGRITRYEYDAKGNVTREENHMGHATATAYDDKGNPTTITDALGRATQTAYTSSGLPTTMTDALGHETKFDAYDARGNLLRLVDATGRTTTSTYDGSDRLLTQTDASGNTTTYAYDARGNVATETRRVAKPDLSGVENLVTSYEYDAEDRVIKTTQPDGIVTNTEYNANGKPAKTTDAAGRVTETEYDAAGNVTKTTRHPAPGSADESVTEETWYDAENHPILTRDASAHWTRTEYDSMGRVIATWDLGTHATLAEAEASPLPPLPSSASEYDLAGQVTRSSDALGNWTSYEYDGAGRRTKVNSPTGAVTQNTYDAAGNLTAVIDAAGNITRHYYDAGNHRTETQFADGTRTSIIYDELGRRTATIDPEGKTTRYIYDEAGRLAAVFDAAQQATSFAYDELGRQTAQIDAEGRKTSYTYNTAGQRATRTLPGGQTESYAYNPDGSLASKTDFNGETVTFTYDGFGRLIAQTPSAAALARGALKATFTYDAGGRRISQTITDANGINQWWESYGYDNYGRLAQKRTLAGDLGYLYDAVGNLTLLASSRGGTLGTQLHYAYDAENRLVEVIDATGGADCVTTYGYTPVGSLQSVTLPNGLTTTYTYTNTNRVTNITNAVSNFTYALSPSGHRTQLAETIGGVSRTTNYTYDDLYRLTREDIVSTGSVAYTHDKVGNRLSRTSSAGILPVLPSVSSYTYDLNDRLLNADARNYTYDANGNTRTGSVGGVGVSPAERGTSILPVVPVQDQYDDQNRLVRRTETENGKTITILYNADGNRVAKTVNGVTTYYLVDSQNLTGYAQVIEEITAPVGTDPIANGTVIKRYAYGLDLISQQVWTLDPLEGDHWRISYYGYDGLGSVCYLTDETATITDRYTYDAFGTLLDTWSANSLTPANNVYLYAGEQWDADLGLYYNRARYLNTNTGRFWSMDSYEGNNQEPLSLHKYLYVYANPINGIDPSGNFTIFQSVATLGVIATLSNVVTTVAAVGTLALQAKHGIANQMAVVISVRKGWGAQGGFAEGGFDVVWIINQGANGIYFYLNGSLGINPLTIWRKGKFSGEYSYSFGLVFGIIDPSQWEGLSATATWPFGSSMAMRFLPQNDQSKTFLEKLHKLNLAGKGYPVAQISIGQGITSVRFGLDSNTLSWDTGWTELVPIGSISEAIRNRFSFNSLSRMLEEPSEIGNLFQ
jgi:RHS repeat-associated protein